MIKINYTEYSAIVNVVFSEELQRLEEWIFSIQNNYDCSADKYWVSESPGGDIPSMSEMNDLMMTAPGNPWGYNSDDPQVVEESVDLIRDMWMSM